METEVVISDAGVSVKDETKTTEELPDVHDTNSGLEKILEESLNFEPLQDLDDEEYGLPHLDFAPSLAQILGQDLDDIDDIDNFDEKDFGSSYSPNKSKENNNLDVSGNGTSDFFKGIKSGFVLEGLSLASFGSGGGDNRSSKGSKSKSVNKRDWKREETRGAIMRHVVLKGISSQLVSAAERVNSGLATVMASSHSHITVGTSHGFILVFDDSQKLKCSLGGKNFGRDFGAVSSLDLNSDSSLLIAGFARGQVVLFDLHNGGKLIQSIPDAHPFGTSVTHSKFTDDSNIVLISDSGGSIFELNFRKNMGVRGYNSRCIFSGSRGEVCALQPLSLAQYPSHDLGNKLIIGLVTISKVIVLCLRPSVKVLFTHPLAGSPDTLPILAWQFAIIQTSRSEKVVDPVLAFGRESTIYFYQLTENLGGKTNFVPLYRLDLNYEILNFGWLNTRCMAIVDTTEVLHLQDVKNQEELETVDLAEVKLVYGSSFFKGLATGGNVSKAMERAGEKATYSSMSTHTNQILLLGRQSFHGLVIRSWSERLDHMIKDNRYCDALNLGCEFFQDVSKVLVGLNGPKEKRKTVISQKVISTLLTFLDVSMTKNFPSEGNIHILRDYFADIVPPCISTCVVLKRKNILFEQVWNTFKDDPFAKARYLESLEPFILSDQLRNLPVSISQEFVLHYETSKRFEPLEASITHLNITSIDIHQVMSLCWEHGLYDAIIYIYNNGMLDFVTPMEELCNILTNALSSNPQLNQNQIKLGNKILVYISGCLAGRAYPYGDIPLELSTTVKFDIYNCLTTLHTKKASETELTYPYLRTLLHFDAQGLFNVISIAFEEPDFRTEMGTRRKERLVDILLDIMVKSESRDAFSPTQVGHLFTFLARQISSGKSKELYVDRSLFVQVLEILTEATDKSHHEERQQALLELLNSGGIQYFEREKLIEQSEKVRFYRIIEFLYEESKEYEKILETFILDDEPRRQQVFALIQKILTSQNYDYETKGKIEKSVIRNLKSLMRIDSQKTSSVIYHNMASYIPLVMVNLENEQELMYAFLKSCFEFKDNASHPNTPEHNINNKNYDEETLGSEKTFELFIDLMCKFDAGQVPTYLSSKSGFAIPKILSICRKNGNDEATAYLLETDGKIGEAFEILKDKTEQKLHNLPMENDGSSKLDAGLFWSQVGSSIVVIVQLCQRSVEVLSEKEREQLWFSLLDSLMTAQEKVTPKGENFNQLKDLIKHVISSTIGHVSLRTVVDKILRNPMYESGSFGDIKSFLIEMLETYHYEETLLSSTVDLVRYDLYQRVKTKQKASGRGIACRDVNCDLCRTHLALRSGQAVAFHCSHKYHLECLKQASCVMITRLGEEKMQCYRCETKSVCKTTSGKLSLNLEENNANSTQQKLNEGELELLTNQDIARAKAYSERDKQVNLALILENSAFTPSLLTPASIEVNKVLDEMTKLQLWPTNLDN